MNILFTNDDGIHFPGIQALVDTFKEYANVFVFAPAMEKSATSQAMTIYDDIYVKIIDDHTFVVNGYPVDCINIALHGGFIHEKIDLVISGINKGVNMGQDIFYSGTVGAARHAYIHGIPAIAVSSGFLDATGDFKKVAGFLLKFVQNHFSSLPKPFLFNINYPAGVKMPEKIKWTKSGIRIYRDTYKRNALSENEFLVNLGGSTLGYKEIGDCDFEVYHDGFISLTPLNKDGTDYNYKNPDETQ
ncbi:MAG: 5'/3'-nucleotidase SurE [Spirochaetia bacterium]|nr:5'/3'-nucleotidase SurE [Spirochaetia bacterium]